MLVRAHLSRLPVPAPLAGDVEVEWTVGPVNVSLPNNQSHEIITRYESTGAAEAGWGRGAAGHRC